MARERVGFLFKLQTVLKNLLLSVGVFLLVLLNRDLLLLPSSAQTIHTKSNQQEQARKLTKRGHEHLEQGRTAEALQTWQTATRLYIQLANQEGITGSLVNQSLAMQAMGQYFRACGILVQSLKMEDWICENPYQTNHRQESSDRNQLLSENIQVKTDVGVLALRNLGDVLRLMGKPDESEIVLLKALAIVRLAPTSDTKNDILLSLGNTEQSLYKRARNRLQTTEDPAARATKAKLVEDRFRAALNFYQQVSGSYKAKQNGTALQALLNRLSLCLEIKQSQAAVAGPTLITTLESETHFQIGLLLEQLLSAQFSQLSAVPSVYARLNLVKSLSQVDKDIKWQQFFSQGELSPLNVALKLAQEAVQVAQGLENRRAKSYAFGALGNLYAQIEQTPQAQKYLEEALRIAQSVQAWDLAYQWQQHLGQLYQGQGNRSKAIEAYEAAVNSLDQVRGNILAINPDIQFDFREKVAPVYRDYMRLLLSGANPNLQKVVQINERLQVAELENFLQCGQLDLVSLTQAKNLPTLSTVIHILSLDEHISVIVQSPNKGLYRYTSNAELVANNIDYLMLNLQSQSLLDTDEQTILSYSQPLYNSLIAPAKEKGYLPEEGTLIFVLDSSLQTLPMSLLHDGQNYLFERYSISLTLGAQLREPRAMPLGGRALVAGLSKVSPSFKDPRAPQGLTSLPEVETEVEDIKKNLSETVELLNDEFTSERFQTEMDKYSFPIVHITTHGQFSSDPQRTVLLAWDKLIDVQQLDYLLRSKTQGSRDSIELLVLSACETAKGDPRSALGISGVAVQAGARSTVATLWLVDAESTAMLMSEFYKGLGSGKSKAEALRQAQLILLKNPDFQNPYFWAPFILVGSWL